MFHNVHIFKTFRRLKYRFESATNPVFLTEHKKHRCV